MIEDLKNLKNIFLKEIKEAKNLELVNNLERKYLGPKGELRKFTKKIKDLNKEERASFGKLINEIKEELENIINQKKIELEKEKRIEEIDLTLPGEKPYIGHLHPHTQLKYQVAEIFYSMGYEILEGPELETDYYNFEALNIPLEHPSRDLWDTFYIKSLKEESRHSLLLRTHTSAMQVRVMEKKKPPLKICVIGKCYRHEATDASHEHTLYQIEGFVVDKEITIANLIYTLQTFFNKLFKKNVEIRLRPSYFPFTEPSFEMDFRCLNCKGKGCSVCGQTGWVEILGCGMINPKVFEYAGYPKDQYTGFAFGVGLDRLVMMKHQIDDIRWFHSGDLRFLKQF
jgi:phenylalanyl-tRNA synthetase alpha chain